MAEKKASKKATKSAQVQFLSDKEIVLKLVKDAVCLPYKAGFIIFDGEKDSAPIHSGIAKTESDAWKRAAQSVL